MGVGGVGDGGRAEEWVGWISLDSSGLQASLGDSECRGLEGLEEGIPIGRKCHGAHGRNFS